MWPRTNVRGFTKGKRSQGLPPVTHWMLPALSSPPAFWLNNDQIRSGLLSEKNTRPGRYSNLGFSHHEGRTDQSADSSNGTGAVKSECAADLPHIEKHPKVWQYGAVETRLLIRRISLEKSIP